MQTDNRETKSEALRDSQDTNEGRRRQDEGRPDPGQDKPVVFPTWRFAKDGRTAIVTSPQELEELEADGGDWKDAPHPADTEMLPTQVRTFAAPVGAVDHMGGPARYDKPVGEVGLTTPIALNAAGSVPQSESEVRRGQAATLSGGGLQGQGLHSTITPEVKRLEAENDQLKRQLEQAQAKSSTPKGSGAKKSAKSAKSAGGKKAGKTTDARVEARDEARQKGEEKAQADADEQSRRVAQG
jgi:hypothetical protein